jgi:hypothetical protein
VINAAGLAVRVGAGAVLEGLVSAPNAAFSSGRSARLLGAFCVDGSRSDKSVTLTCPPSTTAALGG